MTKPTDDMLRLAHVSTEEAIKWCESAMRNFDHINLSRDNIEDVREALERFRLAAIIQTTDLGEQWLHNAAASRLADECERDSEVLTEAALGFREGLHLKQQEAGHG